MERKVQLTADGSSTIHIPDMDVTYHSKHGAIQESRHVFINTGLAHFTELYPAKGDISIFEMGLGTGLNALLTCLYAEQHKLYINYNAVEAYPLSPVELAGINYAEELNTRGLLEDIHTAPWQSETAITPYFTLTGHQQKLIDHTTDKLFDIIYYDAFAPAAQPELWTADIFAKMYSLMNDGGILTTYCSKSIVRKAMQEAGFMVEKLPGPPGKREILRAVK